jgi:hypothetical protein
VSLGRPRITSTTLLMWFGLLGAPAAWTLQHVAGFGLTVANCGPAAGADGRIHLDAWTIVVSAAAVLVTVAGLLAALATWRRTRDVGTEPPGARIHFLSLVALTTTPLFLCITVMTGLGVLFLDGCRQS